MILDSRSKPLRNCTNQHCVLELHDAQPVWRHHHCPAPDTQRGAGPQICMYMFGLGLVGREASSKLSNGSNVHLGREKGHLLQSQGPVKCNMSTCQEKI